MIVIKMIMKTADTFKYDILLRENDHDRQLDVRETILIDKRYANHNQQSRHVDGVDTAEKYGGKEEELREMFKQIISGDFSMKDNGGEVN